MSSIFGLPTQGSNVTILFTRLHSDPLCVFIEFWANFGQARAGDYQSLAKSIQSPVTLFQEFEGNPGDLCLAQNEVDGRWYRSRILSRDRSHCKVILIDKGITCSTPTELLAWGNREYFHLPPEVELCLLANVLPCSPENVWSPVALEFVQSFQGQTVRAHVQDVLVHQRKLLLDIPCITLGLHEKGLTKTLEPSMFLDMVVMSQERKTEVEKFNQHLMVEVEQLTNKDLYMYPELTAGAVATVVVTEVTNPQQIFCQLKIFSLELKKLSTQITQHCKGRMVSCSIDPKMIGLPCAARGNDGSWDRCVLQQVFPTSKLLEVLNVDNGTKKNVQKENVRPLAPEFFRMPVVTYVCSLHGVTDKGLGWSDTQINYLKSLLFHKSLIAKFHYQNVSDGVYYVTIYDDENKNLNNVFCSMDQLPLESKPTLADDVTKHLASTTQHLSGFQNKVTELPLGETAVVEQKLEQTDIFPLENVFPGSSYVARVSHATNPAEFWIQTQSHGSELDELMWNVFLLYKHTGNKYQMEIPIIGAYCAAKGADGNFYRAIVSKIGEKKIEVFFVDYGSTEEVDRSEIMTLPDRFKKTPKLALKCSLAGIDPKDPKWSQSAIDFFIKVTTDKLLNVQVIKKHGNTYVVTLMDPKAREGKDIGSLLCSSGLAKQNDMKTTFQIATAHSNVGLLCDYKNVSTHAHMNENPLYKESQTGSFREIMFTVGSILDVNVSCIESPNNFWCRLLTNSQQLKLMMHNIQSHYADSIYEPFTENICVVRHPDDEMWYRGVVIQKHEKNRVTVLLVDYGQTKTVSLHNLRTISREFLDLHSQAFRCSLFNPFNVTSAVNDWNDEAKESFINFVENASSEFIVLKCTVYAVMYNQQKVVFNVVDLETPFWSISTTMAKLANSKHDIPVRRPPFRLDAYHYSSYNIKIGNEEQFKITCVNSVSQFYCQLKRNSDMLKDLNVNVNNLCRQLGNVTPPKVFGTLCFAKYIDGMWYRAQIKAIKPNIVVHFVDYGVTDQVDESDLLPIPKEATNIMSVPVQAILCSLADIPKDVHSEVNDWFKSSATNCEYQTLVVAKESSGSLQVELYHKNIPINLEIKNVFHRKGQTKKQVIYQHQKGLEAPYPNKENVAMTAGPKTNKNPYTKDAPVTQATQYARQNLESNLWGKPSQAMYRPPTQRQHEIHPNNIEKENVTTTDNSKSDSKSFVKGSGIVVHQTEHPKCCKLEDLPKNAITMGMEADVYVSHYNSPASFYVQLVSEDEELLSLSDKLNDAIPKVSIAEVDAGDLVVAEFAEDSLWYRAGVKEVLSGSMALVEFVDFGNTAQLPFSKLAKLHQACELLPRYSEHCMLIGAESLENFDAQVVSTLKENIFSNPEKILKCHFVQQAEGVWQVKLDDNGVQITCKTPTVSPEIPSAIEQGMIEPNVDPVPDEFSLSYHQIDFTEGQKLDVYISAICDVHTFWCQPADSFALDNISESLSEPGKAAHNTHVSVSALSPGMPCIAFYPDDQLWCRAEMQDKNEDNVTVLFVDYGNTADITINDVGEISSDLLETEKQAFLCKLEGFDESNGHWCEGAFDALASLTEDKILQLTVIKPSRNDEQNMHLVQLECEGQLLNETIKKWWVTSTLEQSSNVTQRVVDIRQELIVESAKVQENEHPDTEDASRVPGAYTCRQHNEAELLYLTSTPKNIQNPVDCLQISIPSTKNPHEERHFIETHSPSEVTNTALAVFIPNMEVSISQIDSGIQENVLSLQNVEKNNKIHDEEDASLSDEKKSPPDKTVEEESGIQVSPFQVLDTYNIQGCSQVLTYFTDPNVVSDDDKDSHLTSVMNSTKVIMIPDAPVPVVPQLHDGLPTDCPDPPEQQNEDDAISQLKNAHCDSMPEDNKLDFPESEHSVVGEMGGRCHMNLSPIEGSGEEVICVVGELCLPDQDGIAKERELALHDQEEEKTGKWGVHQG